jgi:hypothetical protein
MALMVSEGWGEELAGDILGAAAMGEFLHKRRRSCDS